MKAYRLDSRKVPEAKRNGQNPAQRGTRAFPINDEMIEKYINQLNGFHYGGNFLI